MYFWQSTCLKSWLLMLLFVFVPLHTLSQSIEHHVVHIIDGIEAGQSGKNAVWDFRNYETFLEFPLQYVKDSLGYVRKQPRLYQFYAVLGDTIYLRGYRTPMEHMSYHHALPLLRHPIQYGDSVMGLFAGKGIYCKRYPIRHDGMTKTTVDGMGTILLPNGARLENVMRVHTMTTCDILYEGKAENLMDSASSYREVEDTYSWYVEGDRHPIFVLTRTSNDSCERDTISPEFAYSTLSASQLDSIAILSAKERARKTEQADDIAFGEAPIHYTLSQHGNVLTLSYSVERDGEVTLSVSDTAGIQYQHESHMVTAGDKATARLDCNGYRRGSYILHVTAGGRDISEKFNVE